jgi:hypothetical protein
MTNKQGCCMLVRCMVYFRGGIIELTGEHAAWTVAIPPAKRCWDFIKCFNAFPRRQTPRSGRQPLAEGADALIDGNLCCIDSIDTRADGISSFSNAVTFGCACMWGTYTHLQHRSEIDPGETDVPTRSRVTIGGSRAKDHIHCMVLC